MSWIKKMGRLFKKLGFEKGDERSIIIGCYSVRIAWVFLTVFLVIWTFQGVVSTGRLGVEAVAFFSSQAVYWSAYLYYRKKLGG